MKKCRTCDFFRPFKCMFTGEDCDPDDKACREYECDDAKVERGQLRLEIPTC